MSDDDITKMLLEEFPGCWNHRVVTLDGQTWLDVATGERNADDSGWDPDTCHFYTVRFHGEATEELVAKAIEQLKQNIRFGREVSLASTVADGNQVLVTL